MVKLQSTRMMTNARLNKANSWTTVTKWNSNMSTLLGRQTIKWQVLSPFPWSNRWQRLIKSGARKKMTHYRLTPVASFRGL